MATSSLVAGISGLKTSQTSLNVIGDNLANLNTSGFKTSRVNFANELSQTMRSALAPSGGLGGRNPIQIGTGTTISSIDKDFSQGNMSPTGRPLDLGIQGDGFFMLTNDFQDFYSRVGAFSMDKNNDLVDSGTGLRVKGVSGSAINIPVNATLSGKATTKTSLSGNLNSEFNTGAINHILKTDSPFQSGAVAATAATALNALDNNTANYIAGDKIDITGTEHKGIDISKSFIYGSGAGQDGTTLGDLSTFINSNFGTASTTIDASGDLLLTATPSGHSELTLNIADATGNTGGTSFSNFNINTTGTGDGYVTTIPIFDTQGSSRLVTLSFEKTASNTWDMVATMKPSEGSVTDAISAINFNNDGSYSSITGTSTITITYPDNTTQTVNLELGTPNTLDGLTQFGSASSAASIDQDGHEEGFFSTTTVNQDGNVVALFTNGKTKNVGQLQLATFSNPSGLSTEGNNLLSPTLASGAAVLKTAQSGRVGSILSGVLESSNVDIAEEFTKLIVSQRSFQANSRTITTTDEIMQELVNIVR
ncbi:flagellar hook protein [Candidatus Scalindua japonica]|uniref:Flagellar hook protein FlgE n=1 Tax=Candidatus Scalindua japonica TaxID=1284222 RepID=A0A286TVE1_9BACT|nr:flagellar hook-basal body complex protein [Candidatus Scalindua japonica]GAX59805.1 flagellar hook protein [Candidatus Scalindua japonica]